MVISYATLAAYMYVTFYILKEKRLGGSKVIRGIIARKEGEPVNEAICLPLEYTN